MTANEIRRARESIDKLCADDCTAWPARRARACCRMADDLLAALDREAVAKERARQLESARNLLRSFEERNRK